MTGISNGAVLQRNKDNVCEFYVETNDVFKAEYIDINKAIELTVRKVGEERFCISGIPIGGPYMVNINDKIFVSIYVGDVWVLAGQSNMEGNGYCRDSDLKAMNVEIRVFDMTGNWRVASNPLHTPWKAIDKIHRELPGLAEKDGYIKSVGPGMFFANKMQKLTGVPQGLISCAHGGTSLEQWNCGNNTPNENYLFGSMLKAVLNCGDNCAGLFWSQGCSEGMSGSAEIVKSFTENTFNVFNRFRNYLKKEIPIVQLQISRIVGFNAPKIDQYFSEIREQQRVMPKLINKLLVIPTINSSLDDLVHLSAESQQIAGEQAAKAMYSFFTEKNKDLLPIEYDSYTIEEDKHSGNAVIYVKYQNVNGVLQSKSRPQGFTIGSTPFGFSNHYVFDIKLNGDMAVLRLNAKKEEIIGKYLRYGSGSDPYCNITDSQGKQIPSFIGIRLEKYD